MIIIMQIVSTRKLKSVQDDKCSGQVISDTAIDFFAVILRSKTESGGLPNTECSLSVL